MQVKKFEASTIKEALELVKQELGPEAIILGAKDHKKSFGLLGKSSIEITAAISERATINRNYAQSKLSPSVKEDFKKKPAVHQRAFIEKTIERYKKKQVDRENYEEAKKEKAENAAEALKNPRKMTLKRYIDITDDSDVTPVLNQGPTVGDLLNEIGRPGEMVLEDSAGVRTRGFQQPTHKAEDSSVAALKFELESVKNLLNDFQAQNQKSRHYVTQHPGAEYGLPFELSATFDKLTVAGIDDRYAVEALDRANKELNQMEKKKKGLVDAFVARYIMSRTTVAPQWLSPVHSKTQVHLFMGPSGQGKTSTLVKTAGKLIFDERKKVVIATADTFKVGASEQLEIYAQILRVPFEVVRHGTEFTNLVEKYRDYDVILVDYPGASLKEVPEIELVRRLLPSRDVPKATHLVLSSNNKEIDGYEMANRYQVAMFDDLIITRLDESQVHGFIYNMNRRTEKPLYAFSVGPRIPEDVELATRERVLDLIYKITKNSF